MNRIRIAAQLVAIALAAPLAHGQTPSVIDPLCPGLLHVVATADEERPFLSLVPPGQSLGTLPRLNKQPAGFESLGPCALYRAGNAKDGVNGGGPFNYVQCSTFNATTAQDGSQKAIDAKATAAGMFEALSTRVTACMASTDWVATPGERKRMYEDYETALTFARAGSANTIVVMLKEDNSSPSARESTVNWTVALIVRNPNPTHPKAQ